MWRLRQNEQTGRRAQEEREEIEGLDRGLHLLCFGEKHLQSRDGSPQRPFQGLEMRRDGG